jgi:transaldolase
MPTWSGRIKALAAAYPQATEDEIAWKIVEEMSANAAKLLKPIFDQHHGRNGRLSIQTDPRLYRNSEAILAQAIRFNKLTPNMIVKIPATSAGIVAIEEATRLGISINATVRLDISTMGPVCTIMVGRLDDWLKIVMEKEKLSVDPGYLEWAGIAVFKKAYALYRERGYRLRLLSAAFRNHMHWSEFIGGDVVISPPCAWQHRYNASDIEVIPRMQNPVDPKIVDTLLHKFPDFQRAYTEGGLSHQEFDTFGSTRRTLRAFIAACGEMDEIVRNIILPNPDTE